MMLDARDTGPTDARRPAGRLRALVSGGVSLVVAAIVAGVTLFLTFGLMTIYGFLPLSGFEGRISRSIEDRLGEGWKVEASSALLQRVDGRSAVRIRDVRIQHASGVSVRAPQAVLSYAPWALLTGQVKLTGIDLLGVNLRLGVDADGALILDAGEAPVKLATQPPGVAASPDGPPAMVALLAAVDIMAREGGELFALETARLSNSRVVLVDTAGKERAALDNVNISMSPIDSATRRIDVRASTTSGPKDFSIELKAVDERAREASISVRRFQTSDIIGMVLGDSWKGLDGLALSGKVTVSTSGQSHAPRTSVDLAINAGAVELPGPRPTTLKVDGGRLALVHDAGSNSAQISELSFHAGETRVSLAGRVEPSAPGGWSAQLEGSGVASGETLAEPKVQLDQIGLKFSGGTDAALLRMDQIILKGPSVDAAGSATLKGSHDAPAVDGKLVISPSDFRSALALWPVFLSPEVRDLLSQRMRAGQIERLDLALDFPADVMKSAMAGGVLPDDSIKITARAANVRFRIAPGLPDIQDAALTAISTGRTLLVETSSAKAAVDPGRVLQLSEGTFVISDTYAVRPLGQATFRATGGVDALAALLAKPTLREFAPGQLDPAIIRGTIDLRSTISLPLVEDMKPTEVVVVSNGQFINISSDKLIPGEKLEGATLKANYERNVLSLKGEGRISGIGGTLEVRLDQKGAGEASFSATLDQAARQRRGFSLAGLTGPVQLRAVKPLLAERGDAPVRIEVDLTRAAIEGMVPGWSKPAGRAGKLSFSLVTDDSGPDLNDFTLESAPLLLRGKVELDTKNNLEQATFSTARISPGDDLRVDITMDGGVSKLIVRGKVLDARPFLKLGGKDDKREPDVDLDLSVPIVTGFNSEVLGNAVVKAQRRGGEFRALTAEGKIGRASVNARIQRAQNVPMLAVEAEDGGALLRFHDIYRRAYGGELLLQMPLGETRGAGNLLYRDFIVRNEPALRRVLAEGQSTGGIGGDRAVAAPRAADVSDVAFTKLRADFTRTPSRFDFRDIVIWGPQLGFTAQGNIDLARDRIDLNGTFVPSYAFNNAFSQVPIFGRLLGGGQYEGLFAVNFRLAGSFSQPTMTVNPLSAIAPGILRRFVDPGGGGSGLFDR